jgi:GT2 family glycosyltransferase
MPSPSREEQAPPRRTSVVIVSRNSAPLLRRCLAALEKSATRQTMEILVVDNGSRDGSAQIDTEFPSVTMLRLPRNFGLTKARNIGSRTAKGEFLLFLSPAVEVEAGTVGALETRLAAPADAGAAAPLVVDEAGRVAIRALPLPKAADVMGLWKAEGAASGREADPQNETTAENLDDLALMVRRQFVQGMNYLDERYGDSWSYTDLFLQIRRAGKKAVVVPGARAVRHPLPAQTQDPRVRAAQSSDFASGAARYLGKHAGAGAAVRFRLGAFAYTLGKLISFNDISYRVRLLAGLASAQKIDGSQSWG